jgi:hypothetical protein
MAKSNRSSPSLIPAILALAVLLGLGYFLFADLQPSRTEHTVTPPIEIEEAETASLPEETITLEPEQAAVMEEQASTFVDKLAPTPEQDKTVTITEAQGEFVRHDGKIAIPKLEHRETTVGELLTDKSLTPDTPLTLNFVESEKSSTTLNELDKTIEDKHQVITLEQADGSQRSAPLADLLNDKSLDKDAPLTVITEHQHKKQITAGELADADIPPSQEVFATINRGVEELSVTDIVGEGDLPDNALFYLHRVTSDDEQGLWGIIQGGLIQRFRQGLSLEGIADNQDLVRVTIPSDADEPLPTGLSSFLGKVLNHKVESSYIYNFSTRTMGHDPDLIKPGQQLILIHFSPEELKQIYLFFAEQRNSQAQSYGIAH